VIVTYILFESFSFSLLYQSIKCFNKNDFPLPAGPVKNIFLPLAIVIVPTLYLASTISDYWLIVLAIIIIVGIFGQVTVNDTMLGKYTADEWRGRAYAARYFLGFTAAGLSVGLVSILYNQGGFDLMLKAIAGLSLLTVVGAVIFPKEDRAS
jgi:hypothetical protein